MIQAALQGQAQGYRFLMNRYGRQVQLFVAQWVTDMRDVEELTQDVFVRAFEHLSDYDPREYASLKSYINGEKVYIKGMEPKKEKDKK